MAENKSVRGISMILFHPEESNQFHLSISNNGREYAEPIEMSYDDAKRVLAMLQGATSLVMHIIEAIKEGEDITNQFNKNEI